MSPMKEVFKIAGAFVGVIVGAGFASGQEILQFFASFGSLGLVGILQTAPRTQPRPAATGGTP